MTKQLESLIASIKDTIDDAARLYGDKWDSALVGGEPNYHAITSEHTNDVVVRANDDSRESSWLCDYLESVSPENVKALIAALEQSRQENLSIDMSDAEHFTITRLHEIIAGKPLKWPEEKLLARFMHDVKQRAAGGQVEGE